MKKNLLLVGILALLPMLAFAQLGECKSGNCSEGYGTYRFANGDVYMGNFKDGKQHGQGTFVWASGDKYEGEWKDGYQDGYATFTWTTGQSKNGSWSQGQFVREITAADAAAAAAGGTGAPLPGSTKQPAAVVTRTEVKQTTEPVQNTATNPPVKTSTAPTSGSVADTEKPSISIISPQVTRGFVVSTVVETMDVRGIASDNKGIRAVRVNGMVAWLGAPNKTKTTFEVPVSLVAGQNKIWVEAEDLGGNKTKDEFTIDRKDARPAATAEVKKPREEVAPRTVDKTKGAGFRTALVIGNGHYDNIPLKNAVNDADSIANELRRQGWEVMHHSDLTQEQMESVITEFGEKIKKKGGAGLFYYAGHGVQLDGNNYLIPMKASIKKQADVKYKAVNLGSVLDVFNDANNKLNIVVLDACRDNPFAESRGVKKGDGLAPLNNAPVGTFVAYATSPGQAASDGDGTNGLYTQELLKAMRVNNLTLEDVFKKVRKNVRQASSGAQIPWENSSIEGTFYFRRTVQ